MLIRESASYRHTQHRVQDKGGISVEFFQSFLFYVAIGCLPREGFQMFGVAKFSGQAHPPCGVESS